MVSFLHCLTNSKHEYVWPYIVLVYLVFLSKLNELEFTYSCQGYPCWHHDITNMLNHISNLTLLPNGKEMYHFYFEHLNQLHNDEEYVRSHYSFQCHNFKEGKIIVVDYTFSHIKLIHSPNTLRFPWLNVIQFPTDFYEIQ